jgi:hypothetical protein
MTMAVTDEQVATLRAQLEGNLEEHKRLLAQLDPATARTGYAALIAAAFSLATDRRFAADGGRAQVTEYVASVRSTTESMAEIDPRVAERLLLAVYTDEQISDIDVRVRYETQILLLAALVADAQLGETDLDTFLAQARSLADKWLA